MDSTEKFKPSICTAYQLKSEIIYVSNISQDQMIYAFFGLHAMFCSDMEYFPIDAKPCQCLLALVGFRFTC